ncbi:hypothetical protein ISO99_01270 [Staphylococcus sp. 18_1_E_LY]|uniref:Antitoxin n=1 Tax=Staphylococcus lloydii TaxID=2781774 RepID=A0A7T1B1Z5_9STAP|nr:hypothetical protein [Staphylococcus lloydii]MBF7018525.1 hypothetical protein [Staphylococcus lloydii]MBF7026253.1 hypothetical protein [Staphylococcus lloydii]MDU9417858.1 hypothetical protein [Staphylococcus lloydii]QPM76272.1 hypothetical protein ISP08_06130 [Staphylococcus lloydii]
MAENFFDKAKEAAKNVSDKLKETDNEKAKQASEQIDKFTGGSDKEENDNKDDDKK